MFLPAFQMVVVEDFTIDIGLTVENVFLNAVVFIGDHGVSLLKLLVQVTKSVKNLKTMLVCISTQP